MTKIYSLKEAVKEFVNDGDHIAIGGFTTNRKPYAVVHEILRQGIKDLIVEGGAAGGEADLLIGEGRVKAFINAYTANSGYSNVCRRFRKAIEEGSILFEDYSLDTQPLMYHAAALGIPFIPVRQLMGSDLAERWGISREERMKIDKLPNEKIIIQENPFNKDEKVVLLPVPELDVAIIHVQKASIDGTVRLEGSEFVDIDIAMAAKRCIISCEEIVTVDKIRENPGMNSLPGFAVDAIVHLPYGGHPSQVYNYYDYDKDFFKMYDKMSKDDISFKEFVNEYVYGVENHEEYLAKIGINQLEKIKVVEGLGYAVETVGR
jgi:glutaconate CoA-transferase subunit A